MEFNKLKILFVILIDFFFISNMWVSLLFSFEMLWPRYEIFLTFSMAHFPSYFSITGKFASFYHVKKTIHQHNISQELVYISGYFQLFCTFLCWTEVFLMRLLYSAFHSFQMMQILPLILILICVIQMYKCNFLLVVSFFKQLRFNTQKYFAINSWESKLHKPYCNVHLFI